MTMNLFFVATGFTPGFSEQFCMGGGFAGTMISRRGAEALSFFGDGFGSAALGRDDLRVVRDRCRGGWHD